MFNTRHAKQNRQPMMKIVERQLRTNLVARMLAVAVYNFLAFQ